MICKAKAEAEAKGEVISGEEGADRGLLPVIIFRLRRAEIVNSKL